MGQSRRISHWDPGDHAAWENGNRAIARRNLIWSIVTMHVAFSIWYLWSVMVLFMPQSVYGFTTGDKLLVGATAALGPKLPDGRQSVVLVSDNNFSPSQVTGFLLFAMR